MDKEIQALRKNIFERTGDDVDFRLRQIVAHIRGSKEIYPKHIYTDIIKEIFEPETKKAEERGYKKGLEIRMTKYRIGEVAGYYLILERIKKIGKNTRFRVKCLVCNAVMFRYSNKFKRKHIVCLEEPLFSERLAELQKQSGESK